MPISAIQHDPLDDHLQVVFTGARPANQEIIDELSKSGHHSFSMVVSFVGPKKGEPGVIRLGRTSKIRESEVSRVGLFTIHEMLLRGLREGETRTIYRIRPVHPGVRWEFKLHPRQENAEKQASFLTVNNLLVANVRDFGIERLVCPVCGMDCPISQDACPECGAAVDIFGVEKPVLSEDTLIPCEACGEMVRIFENCCPECGHAIELFGVRRPEEKKWRYGW